MAIKKLMKKKSADRQNGTQRNGEQESAVTKTSTAVPTGVTGSYNGYCVKCKEKREFEGEVSVSKTGMNMAKGKCPVCGTVVCRIMGKAKADA